MTSPKQEQTTQVITKFINEFHLPLSDTEAQASIASTCSPTIEWRDHAFHICRTGHEAVLGLRKAFNHCNSLFETRIKALHRTPTCAAVEIVWIGCCKNDIVRPDGEVAVKANGRDFVAHDILLMEVDCGTGKGLITKIDEYYNKAWWDGVGEDEYVVIKGASMKM